MSQDQTGVTSQMLAVMSLPAADKVKQFLANVTDFQRVCRATLQPNIDYGVIPGTAKPTLLKPGAEKILGILELVPRPVIISRIEDWDKPMFGYTVQIELIRLSTGEIVNYGIGACNSMESKYRWRTQQHLCPVCSQPTIIKGREEFGGGWLCFLKRGGCGAKWKDGDKKIEGQSVGKIENEAVWDLQNIILKMAIKRAKVDAALSAGSLSNIFTQDIEDHQALDEDKEETTGLIGILDGTNTIEEGRPNASEYTRLKLALIAKGIKADSIEKWFTDTFQGKSWDQLTLKQQEGVLNILSDRLNQDVIQERLSIER